MNSLRSIRQSLSAMTLVSASLGFCGPLHAEVTATASLTKYTASVGEPVELIVNVTGTMTVRPQKQFLVDGLHISSSSQSSSYNFSGGVTVQNETLKYTIVPQWPGIFRIPPVTVYSGSQEISTKPLILSVTPEVAGKPASPAPVYPGSREFKPIPGELLLPKERAYAGEAIPMEIRFYLDPYVKVDLIDPPKIIGEGFSIGNYTLLAQDQVFKKGASYLMVTCGTVLTPLKTGKLSIGPAKLSYIGYIPHPKPPGPHDMDLFKNSPLSSIKNNPSFSSLDSITVPTELTASIEPQELIVKTLPAGASPGAPRPEVPPSATRVDQAATAVSEAEGAVQQHPQ